MCDALAGISSTDRAGVEGARGAGSRGAVDGWAVIEGAAWSGDRGASRAGTRGAGGEWAGAEEEGTGRVILG